MKREMQSVTLEDIGNNPARPTVLFGAAGSGKSYVAERLREQFGFIVLDDQNTFSPEELSQIGGDKRLSLEQRAQYYERTTQLIKDMLSSGSSPIVYANSFRIDSFRRRFVEELPQSQFVLIQTPPELHMTRIRARQDHLLSTEWALESMNRHERPITVPHVIYHNT